MPKPPQPRRGQRFVNWARSVRASPKEFYRPSSEAEVIAIVRAVKARGGKLRVVGAGHSWPDSAACDDAMMSLDAMNRVLEVDRATLEVTVEAGIRLRDLVAELDRRGLALQNLGSVAEQSLAGVISTATHGTGLTLGNFSSAVKQLKLVTGHGELLTLRPERDHDLFNAAAVSCGAFGVITEVTLEVEPTYDLEERCELLDFDVAVGRLDSLVRNFERVKLWWLPYTGVVQVFTYERTTKPRTGRTKLEETVDGLVNEYAFSAILALGGRANSFVPTLNRLVGRSYLKPFERVDRYDRLLTVAMPPRHLEIEYGVEFGHAAELMVAVREHIMRQRLSVSFVNEVRFVRQDDLWLSPSYKRDSCQFGAYTADGPDARAYLEGVEDIAHGLQGRPHWGKDFDATPEYLGRVLPRYEDFRTLRAELDPHDTFVNDFVARNFVSA